MSPDVIAAVIRALAFIALFQAAGTAMFLAVFGRRLSSAAAPIRRTGFIFAIAGVAFTSIHYVLEAARMAGALSGVFDLSLQQLVFESSLSAAWIVRVVGLSVIAGAVGRAGARRTWLGVGGAGLAIAGFLLVGHTAAHAGRLWLAALLSVHLVIVAFWFGALIPLYTLSKFETPSVAARIVNDFSRIAGACVPLIFAAGVALIVLLVERWAVFTEPYGVILLGKLAAFCVLMGVAALNKWRYGPALATSGGAAAAFRCAVAVEYMLISAVLTATAVMTTFFSPQH